MPTRSSAATGYLMAVLSALCAGFSVTVSKLSLEGASPVTFAFFLFVFATLLSGVWALIRRETLRPVLLRYVRRLILVHVALIFAAIWTFYMGLRHVDPAVASFLNRTEVLLTVLLGIWLLRERFRAIEWVGAALALGGVALMRIPIQAAGGGESSGYWLLLASSVFFGTTELFSKLIVPHVTAAAFTVTRNALLAVAFGALAAVKGELVVPEARTLLLVALVALLGPTAARILYMLALRSIDLSKAAVVEQVQPLFAALLALVLIGSVPRPLEWGGGLLILVGCVFLTTAKRNGRGRS